MAMESGEENWSKFVVGSVPTLFYIPDFINDTQQQELLRNIYQAPISKWKSLKNRRLQNWGGVVHEKGLLAQDLPPWLRRITNRIFEESSLFPSAINHVLINEYLPNQGIMPHQDGPAYFPVVAIVSLGSAVIMDFTPHSSLQQEASTSIKTGNGDDDQWLDGHHPFSVLLMPGSLLVFKDRAYSDYLHGIKDTEWQQPNQAVNVIEDLKHGGSSGTGTKAKQPLEKERSGGADVAAAAATGTLLQRVEKRVSLTCRIVPKVYKSFFKV